MVACFKDRACFFRVLKQKANSVLSHVCGQCEITSARLAFFSFFFSPLWSSKARLLIGRLPVVPFSLYDGWKRKQRKHHPSSSSQKCAESRQDPWAAPASFLAEQTKESCGLCSLCIPLQKVLVGCSLNPVGFAFG